MSQVLEFASCVVKNLPETSGDVMQRWIRNPLTLQKVLREALCPPPKIMIITRRHIIDCDINPLMPESWIKVVSHKRMGKIKWDPARVYFHLSPSQQNGKPIQGHKLREELANEPVLNANVLDYLLANRELIPEEWKEKESVFFWGTVYHFSTPHLCVRSLYWDGSQWNWDYRFLDSNWRDYPAACLRAA